MKSIVVYYSHSGNTSRIARAYSEQLKLKGHTDLFELEHRDRQRNKIKHLLARVMPKLTNLLKMPDDIDSYDLICIGSPVWGGKPAPLAIKFITRLKNLSKKTVIYFQLHGMEASSEKSADYIKNMLVKKGCANIIGDDISWFDARDEALLEKRIKKSIGKLG